MMAAIRKNSSAGVRSILSDALTGAKAELKGVRCLSKTLAEMMQDIHGEKWEAHVDHDAGFILIKPEVA